MLRLNSSTLKQSTTTVGVAGCEREQNAQNTCVVDYINKWKEGEANSEQGGFVTGKRISHWISLWLSLHFLSDEVGGSICFLSG